MSLAESDRDLVFPKSWLLFVGVGISEAKLVLVLICSRALGFALKVRIKEQQNNSNYTCCRKRTLPGLEQ